MTLDEMIAVMQATKRGEAIQYRRHSGLSWLDDPKPEWNFQDFDYRAKPKPLEGWVNFYDAKSIGNGFFPTREQADAASNCARKCCVHVREVEE